jgi:hypothetical protein
VTSCWCGSAAIDEKWVAQNCPQQSAQIRSEIVASGMCATHVLQRFGIDITKRGKAIAVPSASGANGTIDEGR